MELAIGKADFARALSGVVKAIEARNTIPILDCVLLTADTTGLRIRGTDLDIEVTDTAPADVVTPGAVCVDAKLLSSIVAKTSGDIALSIKDGKMILKSGKSRFSLAVLPAEDFPNLDGDHKYAASFSADIASLFSPCAHAMSNEATRFYLNGVFFKSDGATATAVATDGHRLVSHTAAGIPEFAGIIMPRKTVGLLPKGAVQIDVSDSLVRLTQGSLTIVSKLVDGTFPDYERVIPARNDKLIEFDSGDMKTAAARVSVISTERGRAVRVQIAESVATLTVNNPNSGTATDEISVDYSGEPIEVGLNAQYLSDMVAQFPPGKITMALFDAMSPTLFTSESAAGLTGVVMPTRV